MVARLTFLGAARNVTGSRYLIHIAGSKVLVDCGLYQERHLVDRNWDPFEVTPRDVDAVLLTHGHLDHCGLLPKLVAEGFKGPIYCTSVTAAVVPIVLFDSAHIQAEDARFKAKRHRKEGRKSPRGTPRPLYTEEDVKATIRLLEPASYEARVDVVKGLKATFHDVGHILGSASIQVELEDEDGKRSLRFSGDVGRWDRPIIQDPVMPVEADYVVTESTYGDRLHPPEDPVAEELESVINTTVKRGGNIIIPSFSIERAQELLYHLCLLQRDDRIPPMPVFLDSPMAVRVLEVFRRHPEIYDDDLRRLMIDGASPFGFQNLITTPTTQQSIAINSIRGTAIIIAGSGMCNGGRVKHHLVHNIGDPNSTVLFVGYQATGTLGRAIVNGANPVRIFGRPHTVRASIAQIHGFSGHADRDELARWLGGIEKAPKRVFVTHGGETVSAKFAKFLRETKGWETWNPPYRASVELE